MIKLDVLAVAAHPDDAELGCGGTLRKHAELGYQIGIVDLTRGELGTRGTPELRKKEADDAFKILGLSVRENLGLPDGFFNNGSAEQHALIKAIRKYQPEIVLANARYDRHPDHKRSGDLCFEACFYAGLSKVRTELGGKQQAPWRPKAIYHYIQSQLIEPDFIVDISNQWDTKMKAIRAFRSQFYDPENTTEQTYISDPSFLIKIEARAQEFGHAIGAKYGEGFTTRRYMGVDDLFSLR